MVLLKAAVLGILQGLTEFLPISSSAHLRIGEWLLDFDDPGAIFNTTIQLGSILAVMWLYRERLLRMARGLTSRPPQEHEQRFATMVFVAFLPALVIGGLFGNYVKTVLYESAVVIAVSFIAGGIVMLIVERFRPVPTVHDATLTPAPKAFAVGAFQALALVPGVSRSGATIVGGLVMGLDRAAAAELSFFLAMPTMAGAFVHEIWKVRHVLGQGLGLEIAVGFVMAFLASLVVVKPFLRFVGRSGFGVFAWYRIAAGMAILAYVFLK
jgi:undecaprenyl-diphosphatase